jgi:hypothetical protein
MFLQQDRISAPNKATPRRRKMSENVSRWGTRVSPAVARIVRIELFAIVGAG